MLVTKIIVRYPIYSLDYSLADLAVHKVSSDWTKANEYVSSNHAASAEMETLEQTKTRLSDKTGTLEKSSRELHQFGLDLR
jgi:hypothetical protein